MGVERCLDLARFLAAELAHNKWSEMLQVALVGFGEELAQIDPDRLTCTHDVEQATVALDGRLESVTEAMQIADIDVLSGRLRDVAGDAWAPQVLLIGPDVAEDSVGLPRLLTAMRQQRTRNAVALVLTDAPDHEDADRWELILDESGMLRIPPAATRAGRRVARSPGQERRAGRGCRRLRGRDRAPSRTCRRRFGHRRGHAP